MQYPSPVVTQHYEAEQDLEGQGMHGEEVDGGILLRVVLQEGQPVWGTAAWVFG